MKLNFEQACSLFVIITKGQFVRTLSGVLDKIEKKIKRFKKRFSANFDLNANAQRSLIHFTYLIVYRLKQKRKDIFQFIPYFSEMVNV